MKFAHQSHEPTLRKRCKVRHSAKFAHVRCKLARKHTGGHYFGFYYGINMDLAPPVAVTDNPDTGEFEFFNYGGV